jgi:hypothetical protein
VRRDASGKLEVTGQCLPSWPSAAVEVVAGRTRRTAALGPGGEFIVRGLPGGSAHLVLRIQPEGEAAFELADVPLPEAGN